jgi:hypothetical protein
MGMARAMAMEESYNISACLQEGMLGRHSGIWDHSKHSTGIGEIEDNLIE